jgi:hypothetical protein
MESCRGDPNGLAQSQEPEFEIFATTVSLEPLAMMFVIDEPNETLPLKEADTKSELPKEEIRTGSLEKYPYAPFDEGGPPALIAQDQEPDDVIFATNKYMEEWDVDRLVEPNVTELPFPLPPWL